MRVIVPSPLLSYTGKREVDAEGTTLAAVLLDLERQFTGMRFRMIDEQDRIRPHMRVFVNGRQAHALDTALTPNDTVQIIQALSGG
jgi:molybdopterin converting factor small subunit